MKLNFKYQREDSHTVLIWEKRSNVMLRCVSAEDLQSITVSAHFRPEEGQDQGAPVVRPVVVLADDLAKWTVKFYTDLFKSSRARHKACKHDKVWGITEEGTWTTEHFWENGELLHNNEPCEYDGKQTFFCNECGMRKHYNVYDSRLPAWLKKRVNITFPNRDFFKEDRV